MSGGGGGVKERLSPFQMVLTSKWQGENIFEYQFVFRVSFKDCWKLILPVVLYGREALSHWKSVFQNKVLFAHREERRAGEREHRNLKNFLREQTFTISIMMKVWRRDARSQSVKDRSLHASTRVRAVSFGNVIPLLVIHYYRGIWQRVGGDVCNLL
jgi:hypothetical protein